MQLITASAIQAHCGACGQSVQLVGDDAQELLEVWAASHRMPTVDAVDFVLFGGEGIGTWTP